MPVNQDGRDVLVIQRPKDRTALAETALSPETEEGVVELAAHESDGMCQELLPLTLYPHNRPGWSHSVTSSAQLDAVSEPLSSEDRPSIVVTAIPQSPRWPSSMRPIVGRASSQNQRPSGQDSFCSTWPSSEMRLPPRQRVLLKCSAAKKQSDRPRRRRLHGLLNSRTAISDAPDTSFLLK